MVNAFAASCLPLTTAGHTVRQLKPTAITSKAITDTRDKGGCTMREPGLKELTSPEPNKEHVNQQHKGTGRIKSARAQRGLDHLT